MAANYPNDFWYPVGVRATLLPWQDKLGENFDQVVHRLEDRDRELEAWTHYHYNAPACRVQQIGTINLPNNTTTQLTFNDTIYDNHSMHDTGSNPGRITIARPGVYHVFGETGVTGETDYTSVVAFIRLNGTTIIGRDRFVEPGVASADQPQLIVSTHYLFIEGDWIDFAVNQENTSANAESTVAGSFFGATWQCSGQK